MKQDNFPITIKISWYAAIVYSAISIPIELFRRWHQLTDLYYFAAWFDEFLVAGFLLYAVYRTYQSLSDGRRFLTASWGFACGMMYASFFIQLQNKHLPDPSGASIEIVLLVKGLFLTTCIVGLVLSLVKLNEK